MADQNDILIYKKAIEFAKHKRPNGGLGNIYVARTIDRDGNVTSETYGMNQLTEYGLIQYFNVNDSGAETGSAFPYYLYIGDGVEHSISLINDNVTGGGHKLSSYVTQEHDDDASRDRTVDYRYPMYYYPIPGDANNDGIVTCVCKFQTSMFPENIANISQEFNITEYGIGTGPEKLWTHSWVYDKTGRYASITKKPNERLQVIIFFCLSYKTSMITSDYANNRYSVITTLERFLGSNNNNHMKDTSCGTMRRYNEDGSADGYATRTISWSSSVVSAHSQTKYTNIAPFNLMRISGAENGYIDGFYSYSPGFRIVEPQVLSEQNAEEFDIILRDTYHNFCPTSTSMSLRFGENSDVTSPFTQADIEYVCLYDKYRGDYENSVDFSNDKNHWYCEAPMQKDFNTPIYYTDINDTIAEMYVYQNIHTEDPIEYFNNTNIQSIYATDAYWDRASWTQITNPTAASKIPEALKTKRYYITSTDQNSLLPVRRSGLFTLIPDNATRETLNFSRYERIDEVGCGTNTCENYDNGYYVKMAHVYIPSLLQTFQIGPPGDKLNASIGYSYAYQHFCYRKNIVTLPLQDGSNDVAYVTNLDDLSQPYSVLNSLTGENGFTSMGARAGNRLYTTESSTGLLCMQKTDADECVVMDLTNKIIGSNNQFYKKRFDSKMACAIYNTENDDRHFAYVDAQNPSTIVVYDFATETSITTLNLPNGATDTTMMWALNDHIWATNGSSWCQHWDLTTNDPNPNGESCNSMTLVTSRSNAYLTKITAVKDVILIYNANNVSSSNAFFTRTDQTQSTIFNLNDFTYTADNYLTTSRYSLKYIEKGKTLALVVNYASSYDNHNGWGSYRRLIDFGQYLTMPPGADGPVPNVVNSHLRASSSSDTIYPSWITYGEHVIYGKEKIPISLLMPHRLVGRTRTHSTVNAIKHVNGKQFSVTYTNSPPGEWSEDKPGYPPGTLN